MCHPNEKGFEQPFEGFPVHREGAAYYGCNCPIILNVHEGLKPAYFRQGLAYKMEYDIEYQYDSSVEVEVPDESPSPP